MLHFNCFQTLFTKCMIICYFVVKFFFYFYFDIMIRYSKLCNLYFHFARKIQHLLRTISYVSRIVYQMLNFASFIVEKFVCCIHFNFIRIIKKLFNNFQIGLETVQLYFREHCRQRDCNYCYDNFNEILQSKYPNIVQNQLVSYIWFSFSIYTIKRAYTAVLLVSLLVRIVLLYTCVSITQKPAEEGSQCIFCAILRLFQRIKKWLQFGVIKRHAW